MATLSDNIKVTFDLVTGSARQQLASFRQAVTEADGAMGKMQAGLGAMFTSGGMIAGLSGAAIGAAFTQVVKLDEAVVSTGEHLVESYTSGAEAARLLGETLGVSTQEASKLIVVAGDLGINVDQLATGMAKFAKGIGNNADELQKFGVNTVYAKDGTVDLEATLLAVVARFQAIKDPAERAALGAAAFGKAWQNYLPILTESNAQLKEMFAQVPGGEIFSAKQAEDAKKLSIEVAHLHDEWKGLQNDLARPAIRPLGNALDSVSSFINFEKGLWHGLQTGISDGFKSAFGIFDYSSHNATHNAAEGIATVGAAAVRLKEELDAAAAAADQLNELNRFGALAQAAKDATTEVDKLWKEIEQGPKTNLDAQRADLEALKALADLKKSKNKPGTIDSSLEQLDVADKISTAIDATVKASLGKLGKTPEGDPQLAAAMRAELLNSSLAGVPKQDTVLSDAIKQYLTDAFTTGVKIAQATPPTVAPPVGLGVQTSPGTPAVKAPVDLGTSAAAFRALEEDQAKVAQTNSDIQTGMEAINNTVVKPIIDTSSIDAAQKKIDDYLKALAAANSGGPGSASSIQGIKNGLAADAKRGGGSPYKIVSG